MKPLLGRDYDPGVGADVPGAESDIHNAGVTEGDRVVPRSMRSPSRQQVALEGNAPVPVYVPAQYGDGQLTPFVFGAAGSQLVLPRPTKAQRVLLVIVNDLAAGVIRVNLDSAAAAGTGIPIAAGGNLFMDNVVPQNDIHVFAPGAGVIQIMYMNLDATNPTRIIQANG